MHLGLNTGDHTPLRGLEGLAGANSAFSFRNSRISNEWAAAVGGGQATNRMVLRSSRCSSFDFTDCFGKESNIEDFQGSVSKVIGGPAAYSSFRKPMQ